MSKLELVLGDLVPGSIRLVWCDDGASGLASRAAAEPVNSVGATSFS
ncbi:MAG: hypothetical protein R2710_00650 [Acidimicrobiales bacterium]